MNTQPSIAIDSMDAVVEDVLATTSFIDIHTHLFSPSLGSLGLWGIDELLTYHYLEAELFRFSPVTPEHYWTLTKTQRADLVWKTLFVENTPLSEAARGVIAVLECAEAGYGVENSRAAARLIFVPRSSRNTYPTCSALPGLPMR